jgi:hypothetical protein
MDLRGVVDGADIVNAGTGRGGGDAGTTIGGDAGAATGGAGGGVPTFGAIGGAVVIAAQLGITCGISFTLGST